jgi:putative copper export protein
MAPLALLLVQQQALELTMAEVPGLLRDTTWGRGWMPLAVSCLLSAILLPLPRTRARTRASSWVLLLAALGVAAAMGGLGHAAADDQWPLASRLFDALHVVGVGAWIGGLTLMLLAGAGTAVPSAGEWRAFSRIATVMAPVVLLSGVGSTWRRVGGNGPMAILVSDYGKLLLLKIVLALAVMAMGFTQRRRIAAGQTPSRTVVLREVVLAAVVLAATAWMTGTEPPGE